MPKTLKPITELTSAELLEFLQEQNEEKSQYYVNETNDINDFLSVFGLKTGEHEVTGPRIYKLYQKWSQNPLDSRSFHYNLKLFIGFDKVYLLNKDSNFFQKYCEIKKPDKTKKPLSLKHFKTFMDKFQIKSGRFYIKDVVLYNLYDKWVYKNNKNNPLSYYQFLKFCRLFFKKPPPKIVRQNEWFSVHKDVKQFLTPEMMELLWKR